MRLFLASLFTLIILSGFLFSVFFVFMFFIGFVDIYFVLGVTVFINFILWLLGPEISDWIQVYFYKLKWITIEDLKDLSPASSRFVLDTCKKYNFNVPKLGVIPDKNPTAFSYGSGRWNGRIVVTEGIFQFLDEKERASVYAHELGHIKNRDFIVMSIASTLLQLIYEVYVMSRNSAVNKDSKKSGFPLALVAFISYVFYWVGQLLVFYLSRVREYYADEFSAKETDPNVLSSALIKIAYGILVNPEDARLVHSTQHMGISNFKVAKNIGLVYYNCKKLNNFEPLNRTLLYDIKNPWAFVSEIGSTHPLTGKRIKRLSEFSKEPMFNFNRIEKKNPVDKRRLYLNFSKDVIVLFIPILSFLGFPIIYILSTLINHTSLSFKILIGGWLFIAGISSIWTTLYKYSGGPAKSTTVIDLMSDIYASPVRGRLSILQGKLIGRGIPGLIYSEDMMMQDNTGLMFLKYQSWLPVIGDFIFGLQKVPQMINKEVEISGWFLRGLSPMIGLRDLKIGDEKIDGFIKLGGLIIGFLLLSLGLVGLFV